MTHRVLRFASALAVAWVLPLVSPAQTPRPKPKASNWTPASRTADGQPDLEGYWTNATITPLERPAALAGKEFLTDQERAQNEKNALKPSDPSKLGGTAAHYDFEQFGLDPSQAKIVSTGRTSLILDPPDGRIPPLTEQGKERAAERLAARRRTGQFDGPETRPLGERCIIWPGEGPPMLPEAYNSNLQIQQGPGYVVILQEMIHDARVIPLDGRPHLPPAIRQWMGDARGHWEGNTLVVDTTNFTDRTNFRGSTANLHVIERFTRVSADMILYRFTVEDPATWTRPWTAELPITKIDGPLFEYACHEGNFGMANTLSGARAAERAAEEAAKKETK